MGVPNLVVREVLEELKFDIKYSIDENDENYKDLKIGGFDLKNGWMSFEAYKLCKWINSDQWN